MSSHNRPKNVKEWSSQHLASLLESHDQEIKTTLKNISRLQKTIHTKQRSFQETIREVFDAKVILLNETQLDLDIAKAQQSEQDALLREAGTQLGRIEKEISTLKTELNQSILEARDLVQNLAVAEQKARERGETARRHIQRLISALEERYERMRQLVDDNVEIHMPELEELRRELAAMNLEDRHSGT